MTLTVLSLLLLLALTATAHGHRPGLHAKGTLETPLLHWRGYLIHETNTARSAKCRPELSPRFHDGSLPRGLRRYAVVQWLEKWANARAAESRCEVARALSWYRTSGASCVHGGEGSWSAATGNGYWGGFQADMSFQRAYGGEFLARWGTANNWPSWAQIVMAYRGWQARGFSPWPTTARNCGLI